MWKFTNYSFIEDKTWEAMSSELRSLNPCEQMLFAMVLWFSFWKGIIGVRTLQKMYTVKFIQSLMLIIDHSRNKCTCYVFIRVSNILWPCVSVRWRKHTAVNSLLLQCVMVWRKAEPWEVAFFSFMQLIFL